MFRRLTTSRRRREQWKNRSAAHRPSRRLQVETLEDRRVLAALIGVAFGSPDAPLDWETIAQVGNSGNPTTRTNLSDETGSPTDVGFRISTTFAGGAIEADVDADLSTIPSHTPSIDSLGEAVFVDSADGSHSLNAVWNGLFPGATYEVYVFALESRNDGAPLVARQSVTINGGSAAVSFDQTPITLGAMWVNDQLGSSSQPLNNYKKLMKADVDGEIEITIDMLGGTDSLVLTGMAIRDTSIVVDSPFDTVNPNDGVTTLREAIQTANAIDDDDLIRFDPNVFSESAPQTIRIGSQLPTITHDLTILGPGRNALTIDAGNGVDGVFGNGDGWRIFNVDDGAAANLIDVTISGMTLTGGDAAKATPTSSAESGGAILSRENLTVRSTTIHGNSASDNEEAGNGGGGGGICSIGGKLAIADSTISGNMAGDGMEGGQGGGIYGFDVEMTVSNSTVNDNASGDGNVVGGAGGGISIFGGKLTISDASIHDNHSGNGASEDGDGGGVAVDTVVLSIVDSSIQRNSTGDPADFGLGAPGDQGGGMIVSGGSLTVLRSTISDNLAASGAGLVYSGIDTPADIRQTTISGNRASIEMGGIFIFGTAMIASSTITNNTAPDGHGGGMVVWSEFGGLSQATVKGTIIAGNSGGDVTTLPGESATAFNSDGYNLIGDGAAVGQFDSPSDQTGVVDPRLRPLANNGGPTQTHAPLFNSPAIDAGDPNAEAGVGDVPEFDQRGASFSRVVGGRIDVGSIESATPDLDDSGSVNRRDLVKLFFEYSQRSSTNVGADLNADGLVGLADLALLQSHFDSPAPSPTAVDAAMSEMQSRWDDALAPRPLRAVVRHVADNLAFEDSKRPNVARRISMRTDRSYHYALLSVRRSPLRFLDGTPKRGIDDE